MIERIQKKIIESMLGNGKAIMIMGARQVGKSTLLSEIFGKRDRVMWMNGDDTDVQQLFADISSTRVKALFRQQ